jgi:hypothetical protein
MSEVEAAFEKLALTAAEKKKEDDAVFAMAEAEREFWEEVKKHMPTSECPDMECAHCAARDCPQHDSLHYHHDGCPSCIATEFRGRR